MHKFASVKGILPSGLIMHVGNFDSHRKASIYIYEQGGMLKVRFGIRLFVSSDVSDVFSHLDIVEKFK